MRRSTLHFWAGFTGILIFVATGQFMSLELGALQGMDDGPRMAWRSSHIFLFLASALNLVRGIYPSRFVAKSLAGRLEMLSTPLLLVAPVAYLASFALESGAGVAARPLTFAASLMVLGACILLTGAAWFGRSK